MMNYHITSKKKGQEIFMRCLTLLICIWNPHADPSAQNKVKIGSQVRLVSYFQEK